MNTFGLDSISFVNIDVNLCWQLLDTTDDPENSFFVSIPYCTDEPKVFIENHEEGKIVLQFKKTGSTFFIKDDVFWYYRKDLTSITKS